LHDLENNCCLVHCFERDISSHHLVITS
jgi:hypothetical protein